MNFNFNKPVLQVKDHFLSGEEFQLLKDEQTGILKTHPQPEQPGNYYQSDDYLSHSDRKESFFDHAYQWVKKQNLKSKLVLVKKYCSSGKVLDIGAGVGDFVNYLSIHGYDATGYEPNQQAREVAYKKGVDLLDNIDDHTDTYDVVTMYHVLEHVPDLTKQMDLVIRLLKPGGVLIVALPNYDSWDARFFKEDWAAYDVPRHLFHFNRTAALNLFKHYFEVLSYKPMWWDSFYISILSARYQHRKLAFLQGGLFGLFSNLLALKSNNTSSITYILLKNAK